MRVLAVVPDRHDLDVDGLGIGAAGVDDLATGR